jgi:hypothetical protein
MYVDMSTYTLTSKYCQDCERTISTVHIILAITVVFPLISKMCVKDC